jgi:hypothetical protein
VRTRYLFCCPAKLPGFVAGISRWMYASDDRGVYVNLYVGSTATVRLPDQAVRLRQVTGYPWDGTVRIEILERQNPGFDLCLRIPGWTRGSPFPSDLYRRGNNPASLGAVKVDGRPIEPDQLEKGYIRIRRPWEPGDAVELELPLSIQRVYAHPNAELLRGRVALMRGPLLYCLEGVDHSFSVLNMVLPRTSELTAGSRAEVLDGVTVLEGTGLADGVRPVRFTAVPYYAWQNRGIDEMTAWIIEDPALVQEFVPGPGPMKDPDPSNLLTLGTLSASCPMTGGNALHAVRDGLVPASLGDKKQNRLAWWPRKGSTEWAQVTWPRRETVNEIQVFWFADHPRGGCRLPASWRLLYLENETWKPVPGAGPFGTAPDQFNRASFPPIHTPALRIEVDLQDGFSGGIHEWRIRPVKNIDG